MSKPAILVVDDEPDNFDVLETLLSTQNYQLDYAAGGYEAIAALATFNPDLILLDVMMPEIDGLEVCRQIKAKPQWQTVPIIMVTALNAKSDLDQCLRAGADDFITKPINAVELRARVHSMLRIKRQYDHIQSLLQLREETIQLLENHLSELRGNLASSLSHELNTPLNGILGTIRLLRDDLETMAVAEIQELLDWADQSARRLEALTKKFLIYLDLELRASRHQGLEPAQAPLMISTLSAELQTLAQAYNRTADLQIALTPAQLTLAQQYLSIILQELVENACKFSAPGQLIRVHSQVEAARFHLWVSDSGHGMTAAQIARIGAFMQFERKSYEQQGLGMGLKIVKKIVELAVGDFEITCTAAPATIVHLTLPILQGSHAETGF